MHFLYPYFLFAGLLIAIPIIIHLFNFRKYRKIYFSNVSLLEEIKNKTQKTSDLKHYLVLLCRILTIIFLVIAFAQPYIPVLSEKKIIQKNNLVSIYIDNSFSMDAVGTQGRLIDEAKNKSSEINNSYNQSSLFHYLTNDYTGNEQRLTSNEEFKLNATGTKISSSHSTLSQVMQRQQDILNESSDKSSQSAFIISDFQKNFIDINDIVKHNNKNISFFLIPIIPIEKNNVYIDTIWFESPVFLKNQTIKLHVKIINSSAKNAENIPLKLYVNNSQRALSSVNINANSSAEVVLNYTTAEDKMNLCRLELTDEPVTFDNKFYFSYSVSDKISIATISDKEENQYLNALFGKDSLVNMQSYTFNNIDYSALNNYSLIILNALNNIPSGLSVQLSNYLKSGGNLIIFPGNDIDFQNYQQFLKPLNSPYFTKFDTSKTKINSINLNSPVYNDVFEKIPEKIDLPIVFKYYDINVFSKNLSQNLLKLNNGKDFLIESIVTKDNSSEMNGKIYLFASPLDEKSTNFPKHSIFVPTVYKMALLSQTLYKPYYEIGRVEPIELKDYNQAGENILKIKNNEGFEIIPEYRSTGFNNAIFEHNQVKQSGNYIIYSNNQPVQPVSFNYNTKESSMDFYNPDELKELLTKNNLDNFNLLTLKNKPLSKALNEINTGIRLWKYFIILALISILAEILLLRFFKN